MESAYERVKRLLTKDAETSLDEYIENAAQLFEKIRPMPFYSDLCKCRAACSFKNGDNIKASSHLADSQATSLRHVANHQCRKSMARNASSSNDSFEIMENKLLRQEVYNHMALSTSYSALDQLKDFPKEWTVIQMTVIPDLSTTFRLPNNIPSMYITRYCCGEEASAYTAAIPAATHPKNVFTELTSLMEENKNLGKDNCTRQSYWIKRGEHNCRLYTMMNEIERLWLADYRFLFYGSLEDTSLQKIVDRKVAEFIEEFKLSLDTQKKILFGKLLEAASKMNSYEIRAAVKQLLGEDNLDLAVAVRSARRELAKITTANRNPVILILDKTLQQLPWEVMPFVREFSISRIPSIAVLSCLYSVHSHTWQNGINYKDGYFILNPDQTLNNMQERLEPHFEKHGWKGQKGKVPQSEEIKAALQSKEVVVYCGHGSGTKYLSEHSIRNLLCRAVTVLLGCCSARVVPDGICEPHKVVQSYMLALSPCVMGMLWEVTDKECDRFAIAFLERWISGAEPRLAKAVQRSRIAATQFMTIAAPVIYGLPVKIKSA